MPGPLFILCGPSASGKSSMIRQLLADPPGPLRMSVSATTRPARPGEIDGQDYHFWSAEKFNQEVAAGAFLESACVHGAHCYGTLRAEVEPFLERGIGVIMDIDVQGAAQIRRQCPKHVSIFLKAPSMAEYERRLRGRGTEDEATIRRRMQTAEAELAHAPEYHYQIINDDLARAAAELRAVVAQEFERTRNVG